MNLQLDIGNSRVKWRLCENGRRVQAGVLERAEDIPLPTPSAAPSEVWISSVIAEADELQLARRIEGLWQLQPWFARSSACACGVSNSYAEPERMGVDRWLAMLAAYNRVNADVCVIDSGSALTIDFVGANGGHRGGFILPGRDSMERALLSDTDRVRFGDAPRDRLTPGVSTAEAVYNGIQLAQVGAVATALNRFGPACEIFFCGGNGDTLHDLLGRGGVVVPDLVLDGLALLAREQRPTDRPEH